MAAVANDDRDDNGVEPNSDAREIVTLQHAKERLLELRFDVAQVGDDALWHRRRQQTVAVAVIGVLVVMATVLALLSVLTDAVPPGLTGWASLIPIGLSVIALVGFAVTRSRASRDLDKAAGRLEEELLLIQIGQTRESIRKPRRENAGLPGDDGF